MRTSYSSSGATSIHCSHAAETILFFSLSLFSPLLIKLKLSNTANEGVRSEVRSLIEIQIYCRGAFEIICRISYKGVAAQLEIQSRRGLSVCNLREVLYARNALVMRLPLLFTKKIFRWPLCQQRVYASCCAPRNEADCERCQGQVGLAGGMDSQTSLQYTRHTTSAVASIQI